MTFSRRQVGPIATNSVDSFGWRRAPEGSVHFARSTSGERYDGSVTHTMKNCGRCVRFSSTHSICHAPIRCWRLVDCLSSGSERFQEFRLSSSKPKFLLPIVLPSNGELVEVYYDNDCTKLRHRSY